MHDPRVIVALDYDNKDTALAFVDKLDPSLCKLKVGKEMFTLFGPEFVKALIAKGYDVFLDLKFHDIPNTVAKACKAAAELGVWMVNVHASGGLPMMQAAKEAIATSTNPQTKLIAVTVLTSMDEAQLAAACAEIGSNKVSYFVGDVTRMEDNQAMVDTATERYGGVDTFLANAGIEGDVSSIVDYDEARFEQVMAVNVKGPFLGLKAANHKIPDIYSFSILIFTAFVHSFVLFLC